MQAAGLKMLHQPLRRIGVMGGMFDPVHNGHVAVAVAALQALRLDALRLIPCHLPNHRGPAAASVQERLDMVRLAALVDARLIVDDRECLRPRVSYTVETLESLRAECTSAVLVLIVGFDAFAGLTGWHRWQDIFTLANVLVVSRPGVSVELPASLRVEMQQRQVASAKKLCAQPQGGILLLNKLQWDISSTQVREELRLHSGATTLVPAAVANYIRAHGLYAQD